MTPMLASMLSITIMGIAFVIVCFLMMLLILIQKPKGGGLTGAFGGGGGSAQSAFGSKTGDVLTYATIGFFLAFIFLAMGMQWSIKAANRTDSGLAAPPIGPPSLSQDVTLPSPPATQPPSAVPPVDTPSSTPSQPSGLGPAPTGDASGGATVVVPEDSSDLDTD